MERSSIEKSCVLPPVSPPMNTTSNISEVKEYRHSQLFRTFMALACVLGIGIGVYISLVTFIDDSQQASAVYYLLPVGLSFTLYMLGTLLTILYSKFILTHDRITEVGAFGQKTLMASQVKGYHLDSTYLTVYPKNKRGPKMKIGVSMKNSQEVLTWLSARSPNLQVVTYREEENEVFTEKSYGATASERQATLQKARQVATWFNLQGYALTAWLIFFPYPYHVALLAVGLYPVMLVWLSYKYKGLFRLNPFRASAYPTVAYALFFITLAIALRAYNDVQLLDYGLIWGWSGAVALPVFLIMFFTSQEFITKKTKNLRGAPIVAVLLALYGYGISALANVMFDTSIPATFTAKILEKREANQHTKVYYLTLAPWGPLVKADEIFVTQDIYEKIVIGDSVSLQLYAGAFHMPWVVLTK